MTPQPPAELIWSGIQIALLIVDAEHQILNVNPSAEALMGTSAKRILGQSIHTALRFDDKRLNDVLLDAQANVSAHGAMANLRGHQKSVDFEIHPIGQEQQWRLISISPLSDDHIAQNEISRSGDQISVSAPNVLSHEIKNPLAAIRGAAQLLARSLDDEEKSHTDMIVSEVDRIAKLLDRMQSLSASQPAKLEPKNIHTLIDRAKQSFVTASKGHVSILDQFDPSLPDALVDPDYMMQILTNLLANAIDAVEELEEPRVEIVTRFSFGASFASQSTDQTIRLPIEIVVRDNGPGISPELENDVFSPFVTTKSEGQGLGLALVRKLVADMNGRVKYDRIKDSETTQFTVFLPMAGEV